jgi:D-alanyl-D-alanine carboxypeptidase
VRRGSIGPLVAMVLVALLAGCDRATSGSTSTSMPESTPRPSTGADVGFSTAAFADLGEESVPEALAAELQAALDEVGATVERGGMTATVVSPEGSWSGATGRADDTRGLRVDDQFAIASVTKPIVAAQVMQMAEAGEIDLDDPVADHLAADLDFDTNGATIRELLGQRSGIPSEDWTEVDELLLAHPRRSWPSTWLLDLVPTTRAPAGEAFEYANANYVLLGHVIEQIRGRTVGEVLRTGVLDVDGVQRLIYQPDEAPSVPMAMPGGQSTAALAEGGGYLPSFAAASTHGAAAAMASDAPSLARWWRALCAGEIVSPESLTVMTTLDDGYGLGLYNVAEGYADAVGHSGEHIDGTYVSWAGCLPEHGTVVVVLGNQGLADVDATARSLVTAVIAGLRGGGR